MDTVIDSSSVIVETKPAADMADRGANERWTTIQAAAPLIGRSEKTLRRWIAADRIAAQRGPDGRWLVRVPDANLDAGVSTTRSIGLAADPITQASSDRRDAVRVDELRRVRRWAVAGWTLAIGSILVVVAGGVWLGTTRGALTERAEERHRQAEGRAAELRADVRTAERRAAEDRLLAAELRSELSRMAAALTTTSERLAEATTGVPAADERGTAMIGR